MQADDWPLVLFTLLVQAVAGAVATAVVVHWRLGRAGEREVAERLLNRALPWLGGWLNMATDPLSGDDNMPRAQSPGFGASERFSVSPGDEANGILHMPTGQSGHPMSEFYRRGHDDWVEGRASAFLPGAAQHTLTLLPADGTLISSGSGKSPRTN